MSGRTQHRARAAIKRPALRWTSLICAVVLLAGLVAVSVWGATRTSCPARVQRGTPAGSTVAAVPYWNLDDGVHDVLAHSGQVSEYSPWIYGLARNGKIAPAYSKHQAERVDSSLKRVCEAGIPATPTLANYDGNRFTYQPIRRILADPKRMRRHVEDIVTFVRKHDFAGIDIDYEDLHAGDRAAFSRFVAALANALHAEDKLLSVALFAKTDDAGSDPRNVAQDYAAIGRHADQVRLMGYDYHWATSPPGPVAPLPWLRDVLRYASAQIPAEKLVLGLPLSGYDWVGDHGTPVSWQQAQNRASRYGVEPRYDRSKAASTFAYTDKNGHRHRVWFQTAKGTEAELRLAAKARIGGIYLWMFGPADPGTWSALKRSWPPDYGSRTTK